MSKSKRRVRAAEALSTRLLAVMRGGASTPDILLELHRLNATYPNDTLAPINKFVLRSAFHLNPATYGASLRFTPKHLTQLSVVSRMRSGTGEKNWLSLAVDYIAINLERVEAWMAFDRVASTLLFREEPESIKDALLGLSPIDQQSTMSMRLYASLHAYSDTAIRDYLDTNLTSAWFKGRLLYPLIYNAINQPSRAGLAQMLDHWMPMGKTGHAERELVNFLLWPQDSLDASLSYRCYVGMMSHPYDALEYITQYFEISLARRAQVSADIRQNVKRLASYFPSHRLGKVSALLEGGQFELVQAVPVDDDPVWSELSELTDAKRTEASVQNPFPLLNALRSLRWNAYPMRADYNVIAVYRHRFAMLSAGTFVNWFSRSLFLFERDPYQLEQVWVFRALLMNGGMTAQVMMGPHGPAALEDWSNNIGPSASVVKAFVEASFGKGRDRPDRLWISAANWSLAQHQRQGRLQTWCAEARATFPIWLEPRYLSGLDWRWLSDVIDKVGVVPFRGNATGIYVLFLRQVEESLREYTALRLALEPVVARGEPEALFEWLAQQYGPDALAMVRTVLTPDTILKLRLSDNYTAALTARLSLLEAGVKRFNFIEGVLSEIDLERESAALTASLSRMSLGARQFELPWETLHADAIVRNQAAYDAHETMQSASSAVNNTRRVSTYPFANGAVEEYQARNFEWPLVLTIAGVVDTFLSHPTAGIEAILSVRIRHDAFRREIINSIHDVTRAAIPGVQRDIAQRFATSAEEHLSREVNRWMDARMHTKRKGKERALFDFVPSRIEMSDLLAKVEGSSLDEIVAIVLGTIRPKLEAQLQVCRNELAADLWPKLRDQIGVVRSSSAATCDRPQDLEKVCTATAAAIERRLKSLEEWFRIPDEERAQTLTLQEIYLAVQQRFQPKGRAANIVFGPLPAAVRATVVQPQHIRQMYDLLSEAVQNAIKHSARDKIRVRFFCYVRDGLLWLRISNLSALSKVSRSEIAGHPYQTLHDSLFGEGNTGCKKIAYLAASIVQHPSTTVIERRRRSFNISVPLGA